MSFILFLLFLAILLFNPPDAESQNYLTRKEVEEVLDQGVWYALKNAKNNDHRDSKHNDR
jgi:hypothetical protein